MGYRNVGRSDPDEDHVTGGMHLDKVLHLLGDWGRYETLFFIVLSIAGCWFPAFHIFGVVFVGDTYIDQECSLPPNDTSGEWVQDGTCNLLYQNTTTLENCPYGVNYKPTYPEENSAVTEYGLVCERGHLAEVSQSIFFAGVLVGAYVSGQLSDIIGRKPVFLGSLLGEFVFGILVGVSWDYVSFIIFWFFLGVFENGINIVMYVLLLELFAPDKRSLPGTLNNVLWGVGATLLAPIAYFFKGWRTFQIVISLPCLLAIPLWFFVVESPRWLLSRGRKDDAIGVLKRIEKFNNVQLPEGALDNLTVLEDDQPNGKASTEAGEKSVNFLHVFRKPRLLMNAFIMYYSWLVISMVYYGLLLTSSYLYGDKYLNFFLLALVEIPAYIIICFTLMYFGRRPTLVVSLLVAALFCIITAVLQMAAEGNDERDFANGIRISAVLGRFGITASFGAAFVYTTEIFPTSIRNVGFGLSSLSARIGGIIAPLIFILGDTYLPGPLLIFGVSSLVAGILCLFAPETLNRPLPETLEDANNLHRTPPIDEEKVDVNENGAKNSHDNKAI